MPRPVLARARHGGAGFCGFRFTKTLWPGYPRNPDGTPAPCSMGTECPGSALGRNGVRSAGTGSPRQVVRAGRRQPVQPSRATPPPVSVPRSSTARMSSSLAPPGVEFVRYRRSLGRGFRQTAPKTPRMAVRAVFRALGGHGARIAATSRPRNHPKGGSSSPRRSRPTLLPASGPLRITSAGSSATTGLRSPVAPGTGFGGWSTSTPSAPVTGRKRRGQRGRSPPPAPPGDTRSVATVGRLARCP